MLGGPVKPNRGGNRKAFSLRHTNGQILSSSNTYKKVLRGAGGLAPSGHCRILLDTPSLAIKTGWENDLTKTPMGLNNSKFLPIFYRLK